LLVRAVLAVLLMIGFYLLAIVMAGGMLFLAYAMVVYGQRVPVRLLIICVVGAGVILWSMIPRRDRFTPPGPQLLPSEQPELFQHIQQVAAATGQKMPAEIYLDRDVNAWVAQRGGIMGFGSRRAMALGLSLMRVLSVSELRAVLAHEFGHYHGGDTKLGPWVYKTRAAIGRTIQGLGQSVGMVQAPFLWYGKLFLRVTHAISRQQEYTADRLAAQTEGRESLASGLRKTHAAGMAFAPFWQQEMVPALSAGFRPPMAEGFVQFMQAAPISKALHETLDKALQEEKPDLYSTHPPLKHRIAAVEHLPANAGTSDNRCAVSLLRNVPQLERQLLTAIAGPEAVSKLAEAHWGELGTKVYLPIWRKLIQDEKALLKDLTPEALATRASSLKSLGSAADVAKRMAVIGAAVAVASIDAGAQLVCDPGAPVAVCRDSVRIEPFGIVEQLAAKKIGGQTWCEQCRYFGIAGIQLSEAST